MPSSDDYLRWSAHSLRLGLEKALDEISVLDYPSDYPRQFIKFLQNFLAILKSATDDPSKAPELKNIISVLQSYGAFPSEIGNAESERTLSALVLVLTELVDRLFPGQSLIAAPQDSYNYGIEDLHPYLQKTTEFLLSVEEKDRLFGPFNDQPINYFTFPRIRRDDVFGFPILGHEIGHPIAEQLLDIEIQDVQFKNKQKQITEEIEQHLQQTQPDLTTRLRFRRKQGFIKEVLEIRARGMTELISDAVASYLFGPSALFALYDLFAADYLDSAPDSPEYYPPPRYRLRKLLNLLDREGYIKLLESVSEPRALKGLRSNIRAYTQHISTIVSDEKDGAIIDTDISTRLAYEWIGETLERQTDAAKKRLGDRTYAFDKGVRVVPELLKRLALGIPPNEIGKPPKSERPDWRSTVLAAWLYRLRDVRIPLGTNGRLDDSGYERLQRVTIRSIEYIMLEQDYKEYVTNLGN